MTFTPVPALPVLPASTLLFLDLSALALGFPITYDDGTTTYTISASGGQLTLAVTDNVTAYSLYHTLLVAPGSAISEHIFSASSPSHTGILFLSVSQGGGVALVLNSDGDVLTIRCGGGVPQGAVSSAIGSLFQDVANARLWTTLAAGSGSWAPITSGVYRAANATGATTVNYTLADVHKLTLTGNATISLTAPVANRAIGLTLYLIQDGTGSRLVTWPASVKWPSGIPPLLSTAAGAIDIVILETLDGGTSWFGNFAGRGYL